MMNSFQEVCIKQVALRITLYPWMLVTPGLDRQMCLMLPNVLVYSDVTQFMINLLNGERLDKDTIKVPKSLMPLHSR